MIDLLFIIALIIHIISVITFIISISILFKHLIFVRKEINIDSNLDIIMKILLVSFALCIVSALSTMVFHMSIR